MEILKEISGAKEWRIVRELTMLDVSKDAPERPFSTLSGGEQQSFARGDVFAGGRLSAPRRADESSRRLCEKKASARILKKEGFLLVSHDRALLDKCVDHILSINRTDIEVQSGNFFLAAEYRISGEF